MTSNVKFTLATDNNGETPENILSEISAIFSVGENALSFTEAEPDVDNRSDSDIQQEFAGRAQDIIRRKQQESIEHWKRFFSFLDTSFKDFEAFLGSDTAAHAAKFGFDAEKAGEKNFLDRFKIENIKVGTETLTVKKTSIIVETDTDPGTMPEKGILAAVAIALKNPLYRKHGVRIDATDPELAAFALRAFEAARIPVINARELITGFPNENDAWESGFAGWDKLMAKQGVDGGLENTPWLNNALKNITGDAQADPLDDSTLDDIAGASEPIDEAGETALDAARKSLTTYTPPEGVESFETYNTLAKPLTADDYRAIESKTYSGPVHDMRAAAIIGLLEGREKQRKLMVSQILMRAIRAAVVHTGALDTEPSQKNAQSFRDFLVKELSVEPARAQELADKLYEPLKAAIADLTDVDSANDSRYDKMVFDKDKKERVKVGSFPFKVLSSLPEDIKEALFTLVESQHNRVGTVREHFLAREIAGEKSTKQLTMELLADDTFIDKISPIIASDFVPDVGGINQRVFGANFKVEHVQNTPDGKQESTSTQIDVANEAGQVMIALHRMLAKPEAGIALADISERCINAPFAVFPDTGKRQSSILHESATAQYASLLVRGIDSALAKLTAEDAKEFMADHKDVLEKAVSIVAYATASATGKILDGYKLPQNADQTFKEGVDAIRIALSAAADKADDSLISATKNTLNGPKAYTEIAKALTHIEEVYLAAANLKPNGRALVDEKVLAENIAKFAKWRLNTEVITSGEPFANNPRYKPQAEAAMEGFKPKTPQP